VLVHAIGRRTVLGALGKAEQAARDAQPAHQRSAQGGPLSRYSATERLAVVHGGAGGGRRRRANRGGVRSSVSEDPL
jgi:hypothetical protein